jgi:hypothetical protein
MKKRLVTGALAAAVTALVAIQGTDVAAQSASPTWSIVAHFEYADGFNYDYTVATGVVASELSSFLAYCGAGHALQGVVRYYCHAVPE